MFAKRTRFVLNNTVNKIKKFAFIVSCISSVAFILFYAYSIITNIKKLPFLIIYSLLCLTAIFSFILFLTKNKQNKKRVKKIGRGKDIFRYLVLFALLVVKGFEIAKTDSLGVNGLIFIVSLIFFFLQILIECISIFVEKRIEELKSAFEKDFDFSLKSSALKLLDAPLKAIYNKKENITPDPDEAELEEFVKETKLKNKERKKATLV